MKKLVRWIIKFISGTIAFVGAYMVAWFSVELFYLITGRIQEDFEQPGVAIVAVALGIGIVLLIVGYKAQKWLGIDRPP